MVDIEEYVKCRDDVSYFLDKYFKIISCELGLIQFKFKDKQKETIDFINNNQHSIVLDNRQTGKTTLLIGIILHNIIFSRNIIIGFVAGRLENTRAILNCLMNSYNELPDWLKPEIITNTKTLKEFETNVKLIGYAYNSPQSLRGMSFNLLLMDEIFYAQLDRNEFIETIIPITSSDKTKTVMITSYQEGIKDNIKFTKLLKLSIAGLNSYSTLDNTN